ncbi:hypothetical protein DSCW_64430 [Desulfosarcina widdelii]|uniref:Uncharacterized protein n=2 Tax=Desulfosarcina widdelii TaxID=947919 RepID=A0A5K7ZB06_9BACT|nr:hypothetical protein DSCW_64430 [Desulfosarcina widdelii]
MPVTDSDLRDLECNYEEKSSGLMIQALDLGYDSHDISETEAAFAQIGLLRSRHLYALKMSGDLKVVFVVNMADIGLNMSDLTNSIKMFIVRHGGLNYQIIRACLRTLIDQFQLNEIPVLTYPATSAEALAIPFEKKYNLWILNMNHTDDYFRYLKRLLKFIKH